MSTLRLEAIAASQRHIDIAQRGDDRLPVPCRPSHRPAPGKQSKTEESGSPSPVSARFGERVGGRGRRRQLSGSKGSSVTILSGASGGALLGSGFDAGMWIFSNVTGRLRSAATWRAFRSSRSKASAQSV